MGEAEGDARVVRGGSWLYVVDAVNFRCAFRLCSRPGYRVGLYGFRCART